MKNTTKASKANATRKTFAWSVSAVEITRVRPEALEPALLGCDGCGGCTALPLDTPARKRKTKRS